MVQIIHYLVQMVNYKSVLTLMKMDNCFIPFRSMARVILNPLNWGFEFANADDMMNGFEIVSSKKETYCSGL